MSCSCSNPAPPDVHQLPLVLNQQGFATPWIPVKDANRAIVTLEGQSDENFGNAVVELKYALKKSFDDNLLDAAPSSHSFSTAVELDASTTSRTAVNVSGVAWVRLEVTTADGDADEAAVGLLALYCDGTPYINQNPAVVGGSSIAVTTSGDTATVNLDPQANDYAASQIDNDSSVSGSSVSNALNGLLQLRFSAGYTDTDGNRVNANDRYVLMYTPAEIDILELRAAISGGTSCDLQLRYGTSLGSGTDVFSSDLTVTSTTTGDVADAGSPGFANQTVPINNWLWIHVVSISGTPLGLKASVKWRRSL